MDTLITASPDFFKGKKRKEVKAYFEQAVDFLSKKIGNRTQLTKWHDDFFSHMVSAYPDLERGESASKTGRRHISTQIFKQAANLTKQAGQIQTVIDSINPLNIGKKKDETMALLRKFFPRMENFETQVRKYRKEIDRLEKENAALAKKASDGEKVSIGKQLEDAKLKSDYQNLLRFVESIPDDIKMQLQANMTQKSNNHQL